MASVKLGQLLSVAGNILGLGGGLSQRPKTFATQLLKSNPLEIDEAKSPTAHLVKNPLEFTQLQFPKDLGLNSGHGHYIIFYSISNNKSLKDGLDTEFNNRIGVAVDSEDVYETQGAGRTVKTGSKYKIKTLKKSKFGDEIKIGRPVPNSILSGGMQTHTQVTGGVALYMPPGIKTSYSADTGVTELGLAGLAGQTLANVVGSNNTKDAVTKALEGFGGFATQAARNFAIEAGNTLGLGDIGATINKVTATAENNFQEAVFEKINPREFSYTFQLIARNKEEANDIQNIIKFFKFHMHPEIDKSIPGGRYFRVPSEFEIHYAYNDQVNNFLHQISRCVCKGVDIDYGGDNFQTFRQFNGQGAAPVNISMTLNFSETTVLTKQEIADGY